MGAHGGAVKHGRQAHGWVGAFTPNQRHALYAVGQEIERAKAKHPGDFRSLHEGHSILREEFDELWDEVKAQKPDRRKVYKEAMQTAAMAVRIMVELGDDSEGA